MGLGHALPRGDRVAYAVTIDVSSEKALDQPSTNERAIGACQDCQHMNEQVSPLSNVKIIFRAIFCEKWFLRLDWPNALEPRM